MSEDTKQAPEGAAANDQPVFQMVGQFVRDLSFECPKAAFLDGMPKMDFEMDLGVKVDKLNDKLSEVTMLLKGHAKNKENGETVYIAEIQNVGVFHVENVPEDQAYPMLFIEGANLIYPQARQLFVTCVTDGSFPPPMLGAIDFKMLYLQKQQQEAAEKQQANA